MRPITVDFLLDGYVAAKAEVVDISATGLGILSGDSVCAEQGYELRLVFEGGRPPLVDVPARVVWCQSVGSSGRWRGGLRFDRRHHGIQARLESLIEAACSTAPGVDTASSAC